MTNNYPQDFKGLIKPIKKELTITVILAILGTLSLLIAPIAVSVSVHEYLNSDYNQFIFWIIIAAIGLIVKQLLHTLSLGYAHMVEAKFRFKLRKDFSNKLSRLPLGFFSENSSGGIRKLISEDTVKIHTIIAHSFSDLTAGIVLPIACAAAMVSFEWHTGLMIVGTTVFILVVGMIWINIGTKGMKDINTRYELSQREMSHSAIEMIDGIKEIKNFGISGSLFKRFDDALQRFSSTSFEWLNTSSKAFSFIMAAIQPTIMLFLSLTFCVVSIKNGWLKPEYTILFMLLSISLPSSLIDLIQIGNHIRDGKHSINTLLNLYAKSDLEFKDKTKDFVRGDIEFKDVSFAYDDKNYILKNINCKMKQGEITALVGASGSGKTTMARLVARFWDVNKGQVSIGGVDVRDLAEKEILSNISLVFQDISLMNASIADNISISKANATRKEIIIAAKSAFIHDRIMKLANGYDAIYGDENVILSGGEKQRLTIARAFLADSPIVVLDEATAQADAASEMEIKKSLSKLSREKTVIMIAHRLSSITNADKIIVFEDGEIVQMGKHDELRQKQGIYNAMWLAQNN